MSSILNRIIAGAALLLMLGTICSCSPASQHEISGHFELATMSRVIDGDTIEVSLDGEVQKVRMVNIDCPESVNPDETKNNDAGREASRFTASRLQVGQPVWLQREATDTDKYGRLLRHVWIEKPHNPFDEEEVARKMFDAILVENGYARVVDYPPDTAYADVLRRVSRRATTKVTVANSTSNVR